jgi:glycosyltransferase involved in cell wall biosynthesis
MIFNTDEVFDRKLLQTRWAQLAASAAASALKRMVRYPRRHTVRLSSDSSRIARALEATLGFAPGFIGIAPIPAMADAAARSQRPPGLTQPLAFGYLGSARREKGFAIFISAVAVVLGFGLVTGCSFVIQLALPAGASEDEIEAVRRARELQTKYPSIRCIEGELDPDDFAAVMRSIDVLVLSYDDRSYLYRTSGMMADALAVAKVVIVPDDTWMADQVSRLGSGVAFRMGEIAELCKAMIEAAGNFDRLAAAAAQGAPVWAATNNPGALFEHLFLTGREV